VDCLKDNQEKYRLIGKAVPGAAHDLNNALTAIVGYSELLVMRGADPDKKDDYAKKINSAAQNCKSIIQNLMALTRGLDEDSSPGLDHLAHFQENLPPPN